MLIYICEYKGHKLYKEQGHIMVFDQDGKFEFSADTVEEAKEGIDA